MNLKDKLEEGTSLQLQFSKRGGLLPVVVQEQHSGQILMLASVNQEAFNKSIDSGKATFWSTSRNQLWTKGETSGDYLDLKDVMVDCDQDALIYQVELIGNGVCHTYNQEGKHRKSCFYREYDFKKEALVFHEK